MGETVRVLLVSGSLRAGSTNTALLRTAQAVASEAMSTVLYGGLDALPHFNPDDDAPGADVHPAVTALRQAIDDADAIVYSTPEYAGALPGSFKNLLDWTVGGGETYGMPAAWVNASPSPTGATDAYESLRTVLDRTGADIVTAACAHIPVVRGDVGTDGLVADPEVRRRLEVVMTTMAGHVLQSRATEQETADLRP